MLEQFLILLQMRASLYNHHIFTHGGNLQVTVLCVTRIFINFDSHSKGNAAQEMTETPEYIVTCGCQLMNT